MKNKNLAKRWFYTPKDGFLSHLGHFSPFVFWPHFWQRCSNLTAEVDGVLDNFIINAIIIKTPITIPIQTRTISITWYWSLIIYSKKSWIKEVLHLQYNVCESNFLRCFLQFLFRVWFQRHTKYRKLWILLSWIFCNWIW